MTIRWTADAGWHDAAVVPYGPLTLDPATMVLHYGQEIFEGLKAYRRHDGSIASFRPEANAARFRGSASRLAIKRPQPAPTTGAFGGRASRSERLRAVCSISASWQSAK